MKNRHVSDRCFYMPPLEDSFISQHLCVMWGYQPFICLLLCLYQSQSPASSSQLDTEQHCTGGGRVHPASCMAIDIPQILFELQNLVNSDEPS